MLKSMQFIQWYRVNFVQTKHGTKAEGKVIGMWGKYISVRILSFPNTEMTYVI